MVNRERNLPVACPLGHRGLWLQVLLPLLVPLVGGCSPSTAARLPFRPESGLYVDKGGAFYAVAFPCLDRSVKRVVLSIEVAQLGAPTEQVILEVVLDEAVAARDLLLPLDPSERWSGVTFAVIDQAGLEAFLRDPTSLTSVKDDFYYSIEFYDEFDRPFQTANSWQRDSGPNVNMWASPRVTTESRLAAMTGVQVGTLIRRRESKPGW